MTEEQKEKIRDYIIGILIVIIIALIIIIGFVYGNKTTKENKTEMVKEVEKVIVEEKNNYIVEIKGQVKNPGVYELEENKRINDVIKLAGGLTKDANTNYINLSKKIKDEMVIIIYSKKEIEEYEKSLKEETIKEIIKYEIIEKECVCPNTINDACIEEKDTVTNELENTKEESLKENNQSEENNSKKEENKIEETKEEIIEENKLVNINTATIDELQTIKGVGESKAKSIIEYRKENKFTKIEDIKNVSGIGDSLFEKIKDYITI